MIPTWLVIALFISAVIAIYLLPDRHKPWWERPPEGNDDDPGLGN